MSEAIRVLHVLNTSKYSGAENVACQIIKLCCNENFNSIYCSPKGKIKEALEKRDINYCLIDNLSVNSLKKIINDYNPHIIHAHDRRATLIACLCTKKIPIISHLHGKFDDMKRITLNNILYTIAALRVKRIICVSKSINKEWSFSIFYKNKIMIKRNVVNVDKNKYNLLPSKYDICFIGRLVYEKNIPRLLNILKELALSDPKFKAVICGEGKEKEFLLNFIENNKLEQNIEYMGFVNDPLIYIAQSKLMIMTSKTEGTPMGALEALSLGKPVISTPVDGLVELIQNGKNGYLSNDDNEIIEYINKILSDSNCYKKLCINTLNMNLKINDVEEYKKFFITLYKDLI